MKTNTLFMAFSTGKESIEGGEVKRYIGIAPVKILAVNPNKAEQEKIYNTTLEKEPEYVGNVNVNGNDVQNVRISFVVETDPEKCNGIDITSTVSFFIQNGPRVGSQSGKYQIIDKYGRTAWATREDIDAKRIPVYSNGPANIDSDYRVAYAGEEDLTNFLKAYLNIPNVDKWEKGQIVGKIEHPEDAEARLDNIADFFKGDFKSLKEIISYQPNNKVKVLFGVRTTDDGKEYQAVYTNMVLKNSVNDYSRLDKDLQERKANGAYSSTTFEVCPLKEYTINPTAVEDLPQGSVPKDWFK